MLLRPGLWPGPLWVSSQHSPDPLPGFGGGRERERRAEKGRKDERKGRTPN